MIRRPPRSTLSSSSAASDVYKRQPVTPFDPKTRARRRSHLLPHRSSGSPEHKTHRPSNEEGDRDDPRNVKGESLPGRDQCEQYQNQNWSHTATLPPLWELRTRPEMAGP